VPTREQLQWKHVEEERLLRRARKELKRKRKPDPVRKRNWIPEELDDPETLYELDTPASERVMPAGEQERRRAFLTTTLANLDDDEATAGIVGATLAVAPGMADEMTPQCGTVVEVGSSMCRVGLGERILLCALRGSLTAYDTGYTNVVAVGDEVMVSANGTERGVVEAVLPRRSALVRPDVFYEHLQQVIVANADQLLIVAAWREPAIWLELVDRYLITAERNHLAPIICVNKIDLADHMAEPQATLRPYQQIGYPVIFTSAITGEGVSELHKVLRLRTTVLAGLSGVGKSSLLAAMQPGLQLRTAEVSDRHHEGRHTTAQVTMHALEVGGYVVDTPGIREFGLSGLHREQLAGFYKEFGAVAGHCRFANCIHLNEPGCAVQMAVHQGRISAVRYRNYRKIYETLPA
jgi:ribosome biogenesis GTPase